MPDAFAGRPRLSQTELKWFVFETSTVRSVGDAALNPSLRKRNRDLFFYGIVLIQVIVLCAGVSSVLHYSSPFVLRSVPVHLAVQMSTWLLTVVEMRVTSVQHLLHG